MNRFVHPPTHGAESALLMMNDVPFFHIDLPALLSPSIIGMERI